MSVPDETGEPGTGFTFGKFKANPFVNNQGTLRFTSGQLTAQGSRLSVEYMKATFEIDAKLVLLLHETAQRRGTTAFAILEEAIRALSGEAHKPKPASERLRPLPSWPMGEPLVDIDNRAELHDKLEDRDRFRQLYGVPLKE